jgi:hypothetical protein
MDRERPAHRQAANTRFPLALQHDCSGPSLCMLLQMERQVPARKFPSRYDSCCHPFPPDIVGPTTGLT